MASLAMAFPILPGKTEQWKHFCQEITGPRNGEYEASLKRVGQTRAALYLQQTPQGDLVVLYQEAPNIQQFFELLGMSQEPFLVWFREQVKEIHGVDFAQPLPGPLPEAYLDWRAK